MDPSVATSRPCNAAVRIRSVTTQNIGGLVDQTFILSPQSMIALAGPNGTGKSKLLACMLSVWTTTIPDAADPNLEANVSVLLQLTDSERDILQDYDSASMWNQGRPPELVTISTRRAVLGGSSRSAEPNLASVTQGFYDASILERCPSMDIVYLPAERRLMPSNNTQIDLSQLAEAFAVSKLSEARSASSFGRLDDSEFESYAKAFCIAGALPSEDGNNSNVTLAKNRWQRFKSAIDELLSPKSLLPLSAEHPEGLRIRLPSGKAHPLDGLSSGERQALVILSRVFRAGDAHSIVAIDEPDAFLHPALSVRLMTSLQQGAGPDSQMIVATHSPAILDSMAPEAIYKITSTTGASAINGETDRLQLYRDAGFRASAVSQADDLVVTEGTYDSALIPLALPDLGNIAFRAAGGRASVLRTLESLAELDLPIIGIIDRDVDADEPSERIRSICHIWGSSDIEAVMLADDNFLHCGVTGSLFNSSITSVEEAKQLIATEVENFRENAIAEMAARKLRTLQNVSWPSPRGQDPLGTLMRVVLSARVLDQSDFDEAVEQAAGEWEAETNRLRLVRGKWILPKFTRAATGFKDADAFVHAVLARRPTIAEFAELAGKISQQT